MCQSAHETQQQRPKQRFNGYAIWDGDAIERSG